MADEPKIMQNVTCRDCASFIPDAVGDGFGIGECKTFTAYKNQHPGDAALRRALALLGNHNGNTLFWGGGLKNRDCKRFKEVLSG